MLVDEALIRVDPLIGYCSELWRMVQQTGDEMLPGFGECVIITWIMEGVHIAFEEREVRVHSRTVRTANGLRHEGGVHAEASNT